MCRAGKMYQIANMPIPVKEEFLLEGIKKIS
jgi:hypothetical protein